MRHCISIQYRQLSVNMAGGLLGTKHTDLLGSWDTDRVVSPQGRVSASRTSTKIVCDMCVIQCLLLGT
jgi:hypothetical protein